MNQHRKRGKGGGFLRRSRGGPPARVLQVRLTNGRGICIWYVSRFYNSVVPEALSLALALVASYLIGSVSFGILVSRARGVDIRNVGSKNPGASNVLRVLGKRDAALVLLGDGFKGALAAWLGTAVGGPEFGYVTLLAAVIGHTFPIWHRFVGGKSVAAALGGVMFLAPAVGIVLAVVWLAIVLIGKTASLGSIAVMVLLVVALWIAGRPERVLFTALVIALFVIFRHKDNIMRLIRSEEQKVTE